MSRVKKPNKYVNTTKYDASVTGPSKMVRIHSETEDYHKASSLSSWLFMKYDLSYKTYRNKSKARREQLREEYCRDTGKVIPMRAESCSFEQYLARYGKTLEDCEASHD